MKGMIVILSGPSGCGKGTVYKNIAARRKNVKKLLSLTTRPRREDDVEGESYMFVNREEFEELEIHGKFLETNEYDGEKYGTLNVDVEELSDVDIFFDKDVNGALAIKKKYPQAVSIYIMPKNVATLIERRGNRGKNRHEISKRELPLAKELDFLVINDEISKTVETVEQIIECMRNNSMKNKWNIDFLDEFY